MSGKVLIYGRGGGIGSFEASSLAQNGDGLHFTGRDEHKLKAVTEATFLVDLSGASGRLRGMMAFSSDLLAEAIHGTGLLTGDDCC